ncbi:MAG TPA: neutral/alkaline non-lysosomal ceramidase N-terminal domain-containing protein [Ktedonobacteraceae bacterium]|jgi:neutral ceramidase|nr:neutral/alkaline non-lysosomal ceramidase N-terminal domain-containing protein [Ktedonobacteraceae bacterium]
MFTEGFAAGRELLMGVARAVITPPMGSEMSGFIARHSGMIGVHDHLYARAMVWSNGNKATRAVLLTLDLIGLDISTVEAIRQRIVLRTGIAQEQIAVTTTHTHGGPSVMEGRLGGHVSPSYLDFIEQTAADAVEEAANKLVPVSARFTIGAESTVGKNRRISDGVIDPSVPVVRFDALDGRVHAILLGYACHPVTLGADNYLITADYPGYTVRALEAVYPGAHLQFVTGCCGQINTGHSAQDSVKGRGLDRRTYAECQRLGHLIAGAALQASERGAAPSGVPLAKVPDQAGNARVKVLRKAVELPLLPVESSGTLRHDAEQYRKEATRLQRNGMLTGEGLMLQAWAEWAERTSAEEQPARCILSEIMLLVIGEISILLLPGEPFVELGLEIKRRAGREALMVIGYANGNPGYIPHRSAYEAAGYEVMEAYRFYNYPAAFAPEAGEMLVEEGLRLLGEV